MLRLQRKLPVASFSSTEASSRSSTLSNMVILPVAAWPLRSFRARGRAGCATARFVRLTSMGGRVFPADDGRRCARHFLADGKIKLDVGIGFVQAGLVNSRCIGDAGH